MTEWNWQEHKVSVEITHDALPPVRLPDPWWRKPLVAVGVVKPKYRAGRFYDLFYGDNATVPRNLDGLARFIRR